MLLPVAERLVKDIRPAYAAAFVLAALPALYLFPPAVLLVPLFLETAFRLLLRLAYGGKYLYRIRPFLLEDHPVYGYRLRPGVDTSALPFPLYEKYAFRPGTGIILDPERNKSERLSIKTNSLGFRGPEFSPQKPAGVLRVFCSGGSTTAGHCVAEGETWPAQLQKGLDSRGVKAEVINAGVYGWDSCQELLRFKSEIAGYQPDVVLLHQGWNEEFNYSSLNLGKDYRPKTARGYYDKYFFYTNPSPLLPKRFLTFVLLRRSLGREKYLREKMAFTVPERWLTLKSKDYMRDWLDNVAEIAELCRERGIKLFLVDYPCLVRLEDGPDERKGYIQGSRLTPLHAHYQAFSKARIEEFFALIGDCVPVIDAKKAFAGLSGSERLSCFSDELHLTPKGEALLGAALAEPLAANPPSSPDAKGLRALRERAGANSKELANAIDQARNGLLKGRTAAGAEELPSDRYVNY